MLLSCVGTIQDNAVQTNPTNFVSPTEIMFEGVKNGSAISHDKVALYFKPAAGGSGNFNYSVFINGSETPSASISPNLFGLNGEGYYRLVVDKLLQGMTYTFVVRAYDRTFKTFDENNNSVTISTLSYLVPVFSGVEKLENLAGLDGESKIKVFWAPAVEAAQNSNPFGTNPHAISGYKIYVGTRADSLSLAATVDGNSTSVEISSLNSGTNYFVRVRALNSQTPAVEDLNDKLLEIKTLTTLPIDFKGLKTATIPSNSFGFSVINLNWEPGQGSYDRYWVFMSDSPKSVFDPTSFDDITKYRKSVITTLSTVNHNIPAPTPHQIYYVSVVACSNSSCSQFKGNNVVKSVKTSPPVALFSGIKTISQPAGLAGLSSINLTWDAPDTNSGVFDVIRIFKTDSAGFYNPSLDEMPIWNGATPNIPGMDISTLTSTSVTVRGLTSGQEHCFVAKAYSTTPADPTETTGLGRTHTSTKKMCLKLEQIMPGFIGASPSCDSITTSSLRVNWPAPNPTGIFENFVVWYKVFTAPFFNFDDVLTPVPASTGSYSMVLAASDATSVQLTNLTPGTTYEIGVKTWVSLPPYYDANLSVSYCTTEEAKAIHNGWLDIVAVGPKTNGMSLPTPTLIKERVAPYNSATGGPVDGLYNHRYIQEYPAGNTIKDDPTAEITASQDGIVRLSWPDFTLSGGLGNLRNFPGSGYNIYRKAWKASDATIAVTINDLDWGQPLNGNTPIPVSNSPMLIGTKQGTVYFSEWIDYTVDRTGLDDNETKIYWYKVEATINGSKVPWETVSADTIVKVTLPPNNMALMHRWIANKEMCDMIQRNPERGNNYRCPYNGLGSQNGYFDMGKDYLFDRFGLGMKFTRQACTQIISSPTTFIFEGDGQNGTLVGDCLGFWSGTNVNGKVSAVKNSAIYNRNAGEVFINRSNGTGSTWIALNTLETTATDATTKIPEFHPLYAQGGEGLGAKISSNASKLPHFVTHPIVMNRLCASHQVKHQGSTYSKRLPNIKELFRAGAMSPFIFNESTNGLILSGTIQNNPVTQDPNNPIVSRDCYGLRSFEGTGPIDFTKNNWPVRLKQGPSTIFGETVSSIPLFWAPITGSANDSSNIVSSEACQTRYGIQDFDGAAIEATANSVWCEANVGCSSHFKQFSTQSEPFTPIMGSEHQDIFVNGNGEKLSIPFPGSAFGFVEFFIDRYVSGLYSGAAGNNVPRYISPSLGFQLSCKGSVCLNENTPDDNHLLTRQTSSEAPLASITDVNLLGNLTSYFHSWFFIYPFYTYNSSVEMIFTMSSQAGGANAYIHGGSTGSRYHFHLLTRADGWGVSAGGHCAIALP